MTSHTRLSRRSAADLRAIARATRRIEELTRTLDEQLSARAGAEDQLPELRRATRQITQSANDGIQAYRRVAQAIRAEESQDDGDAAEIERTSVVLAQARTRMLDALEVASKRYPWADPWQPSTG